MSTTDLSADRADRRARVAALIARYPELSDSDLEQLHYWFRREASALELGLLASDPAIALQYRAYRAKHYDRVRAADWTRSAIFIGLAVGVVALVVLMMR